VVAIHARAALILGIPVIASTLLVLPDAASGAPQVVPATGEQCVSPFADPDATDMPLAEAVTTEGFQLDRVAKAYGKSSAKLYADALDEPSLHVTTCGELFYVDEVLEDGEMSATDAVSDAPPASVSPKSAAKTPTPIALSSRPKSQRTIYLNFTGSDLANTAWIGRDKLGEPLPRWMPGLDLDGDPLTFDERENGVIESVFHQVVDHFAAFDVNITTVAPGWQDLVRSSNSDATFGSVVHFLRDDTASSTCQCSGIALVNTFDRVQSGELIRHPALVFLNGSTTQRLAFVAAHEIGHLLSLEHHGLTIPLTANPPSYCRGPSTTITRSTSSASRPTTPIISGWVSCDYYGGSAEWAPIMGSAGGKLSQWSDGRFLGLRPGETSRRPDQDDVAIMAAKGLPLLGDENSASIATATNLTEVSQGTTSYRASGSGVLNSGRDTDFFRFLVREWSEVVVTVSGPKFQGAWPTVRIRDANAVDVGLGEPRPIPKESTQVKGVLPPGTYYVEVAGGGKDGVFGPNFNIGAYRVELSTSNSSPPEPIRRDVLLTQGAQPPRTNVGSFYGRQIGALTWSVAPGSQLPAGVQLSPQGVLSGRPSQVGTFTADVRGVAGSSVVTVRLRLFVAERLRITASFVPTLYRGLTNPSVRLTVTGGSGTLRPTIALGPNSAAPRPTFAWQRGWDSSVLYVVILPRLTSPDRINLAVAVADEAGGRVAWGSQLRVETPPAFPATSELTLPPVFVGESYDAPLPLPEGGLGTTTVRTSELEAVLQSRASALRYDRWTSRVTGRLREPRGDIVVPLVVQDGYGRSGRVTYRIPVVVTPPPSLDGLTLPSGTVGQPYSAPVSATGGEAPIRLTFQGLPQGLSYDRIRQRILGTPRTARTYSVKVTAQDSAGRSVERVVPLSIAASSSGGKELPRAFASIFPVPTGVTWTEVDSTALFIGAEGTSRQAVPQLATAWQQLLLGAGWTLPYDVPSSPTSASIIASRGPWVVTMYLQASSTGTVISLTAVDSTLYSRR